MSNTAAHLIIRKWRTPNHSNKKELDDSHEVKDAILKDVGKENYKKQVGENPDLDINTDGNIILKGVGKYKKKPYYVTGLSAEDYFVLRFIPISDTNETEIHILTSASSSVEEINIIANFYRMYIIPKNEDLIQKLIDTLINEYKDRLSDQVEDYIILFH